MRGCHCRLLPRCGLSCEFARHRDRGLGRCGAMKPGKLIPCIERDDGTADFDREANFRKSAALPSECDDRVGAADDDCVTRLPHSRRDREFDMRVCRVAVVRCTGPPGGGARRPPPPRPPPPPPPPPPPTQRPPRTSPRPPPPPP